MSNSLPLYLLQKAGAVIEECLGLHFPVGREADLEKGLQSAYRELGYADVEACARGLVANPLTKKQLEILATHLTIGETYFFRDQDSYDHLKMRVLLPLIAQRRYQGKHLRFWCAACSTGEEPYSLAILLHEILPDLADWKVTILATDINPQALSKAKQGRYRVWSFRGTPTWIRSKYFQQVNEDEYEVAASVRRMVRFEYLNLVADTYPSLLNDTTALDLILCRNVLIYFSLEQIKRVIGNLYLCLRDEGWFVTSPTEATFAQYANYTTVQLPGVFFFQRPGASRPNLAQENSSREVNLKTRSAMPQINRGLRKPKNANASPTSDLNIIPPLQTAVVSSSLMTELSLSATLEQAQTLYNEGQYVEAIAMLNELLSREPQHIGAMTLLARCHANLGQFEAAHNWCDRALVTDKLNPSLYYLNAVILQEQSQFEAAIANLKKAIYLDNRLVVAHFALGNLCWMQGRWNEGQKFLQNALNLLQQYEPNTVLAESEGLTAGRLRHIIMGMIQRKIKQ